MIPDLKRQLNSQHASLAWQG